MAAPILSYCMNVHPGEGLDDLVGHLTGPTRRVREALGRSGPMGAGLWLPGPVARAVVVDVAARERVRAALAEAGLFAYTVNAFPIGGFHAASVKREVYRPSWSDPRRLAYTLDACRALAALLPDGGRGSVSTVPVTYGAFPDADAPEEAAAQLGRAALALQRLEEETGRSVALALEPEPLAYLETAAEAAAFFERHLLGGAGRAAVEAGGLGREAAEAALRERLGVCLDTCHLACAFEPIPAALETLAAAGVRVVKAQLSSALELVAPDASPAGRRRLAGFAEPRYLHQSIGLRPGGERVHAEDLGDLLDERAELRGLFHGVEAVRTHFHVPVCWAGDGVLGTTQAVLADGLAAVAAATDHLEVETYTFDVLPAAERARYGGEVERMLAAELAWVSGRLTALGVEVR